MTEAYQRPDDQTRQLKIYAELEEFRKIQNTIESQKPEGKTNGDQGIAKAYEVCRQNWIKGGNNRIILATDGEFSVTPQTQALIKSSAEQEMFLSIFSFAKNSNSLDGLKRLAQAGKGNFETITYSNIDVKLMSEAQGKKNKKKSVLLRKRHLEVDQQKAEQANNGIGHNYRPQHQRYGIHHPHHRAQQHNQQHGHAQVTRTARTPGLIHLRNKGDAGQETAEVADQFNEVVIHIN